MIMNMNEKGRQTKLLAAVAIIAMVVCAFAMVIPSDTEAAPSYNEDNTVATVSNYEDFKAALENESVVTIALGASMTIPDDVTISKLIDIGDNILTITGDVTVDYSFSAQLQHLFTIGAEGSIIINGGSLTIDVDNDAKYTPTTGYGNIVFHKEAGGYLASGNVVLQSGSLTVTENTAVNGQLASGNIAFVINGGAATFNGNGIGAAYFVQNGGTVSFDSNNGRLQPYYLLNAGTLTVDGSNGSNPIFTPYGMYIASGATLNVNGSMDIFANPNNNPVAEGISSNIEMCKVSNNGTIVIAAEGKISIPAKTTLDNNGTITNNGTNNITNNGTFNTTFTSDETVSGNIEDTVFASGANEVTMTSGTISGNVTIPTGKTLIIGDNVTLTETTFTVSAATDFVGVDTAAPKSFSVKIDNNTISFTDVIGKVVVTKGSVYINDAEYDGFSGKAEVNSADGIEINGKVSGTFDLTVANTTSNAISIKAGDKLIIESGATLNIILKDNATDPEFNVEGTLDLYGGITYDGDKALNVTKSGSGVINIYSGSSVDKVTLAGDFKPEGGQFEFGDTLNSSYTVTTDEYLSQDLTIPAGVTLTIGSSANLNLAGHNIYVYGTLDIQANGSISGTASGAKNTVYLMRNGAITNAGTIGEGTPVTVSADTTEIVSAIQAAGDKDFALNYVASGSVKMQNISGISFGLANTGATGTATYQLTVTGDVQYYGMANTYTAEFDGVRIVGDLYVGQGISVKFVDNASKLMSSATLTIDGTADAGTQYLVMANNSTIVVNGELKGTVKAETGDYKSGYTYTDAEGTKDTTFSATATNNAYLTGYTLTVGTYEFQQGTGSDAQAMIAQRLYIEGTISYATTAAELSENAAGTIALSGVDVFVAEGTTLSLPAKMASVTGATVVVEGEINYVAKSATALATDVVKNFEGAYYSVTVTTPARATTGYIVPFETAMGAIENADNKKVTVMGDLEIVSDLTIATGQTLDISKAVVTIDEDAEVILQTRAILTGPINDVDGMFTAYNGATYVAPTNYDTYAKGTDYVRYSGIVAALNNAVAGDVIDVTREVKDVEDLTVPQGVTVNATANITIDGDLVVETEATLKMANSATLALVGEKSTATIDGTLNLEEGIIAFTHKTDDNSLTSAGTTVMTGANFDAVSGIVNGAVYTNEDSMKVITNAAAALAAAAAQDINKTVSLYGTTSSGDLTAGVDIVVESGAKATVSSIALADGETITLNGELTGAVTVQTGVAGSETASTVDLNKASGIVITAGSVTDNQGVKTYELQLANATNATMAGKATVSAGTANIATNGTLTVDGEGAVLTVVSGATLIVGEKEVLNVGNAASRTNANATPVDAVVINGTLVADKGTVDVGYTGATKNGYMLVAGTFTVADETDTVTVAQGSVMTVTGTLDISTTEDKEAVVNIDGILVVGEKPVTVGAAGAGAVSGAVKVADSAYAYIKAYNGADLTAALINIGADGETTIDSTAFYINSELYMTVYAEGNVVIGKTFLENEKFALTGYLTKYGATSGNNGIDIIDLKSWFSDADMSVNVDADSKGVGELDAIYFKAQTATVDVVISVGQGISLYIDNIRMTSGATVPLTVGTHTVTATVDPGFKGDVTVQFNGQAVTGSFTITPEMAAGSYEGTVSVTATGNITQDSTVVVDGGSSDSGMGLTDYLLIILVILIVVMAIMVAMRLMRS